MMLRFFLVAVLLAKVPEHVLSVFSIPCEDVRDPTNNSTSLFLWPGGGSGGLGNTLVGFLTSFYDSMRLGRHLVMSRTPEFTFNDVTLAFDVGLDMINESLEYDQSGRKVLFPSFHIDPDPAAGSATLGPAIIFRYQQKQVDAENLPIVQSRHSNVHYERPPGASCYFRALGCSLGPSKSINIQKQEASPLDYCGDTMALRKLILGVSGKLLDVASIYRKSWVGNSEYLEALLRARSSDKTRLPIWDVAVHIRVGFKFVEMGQAEADNTVAIRDWLGRQATRSALQELANQVGSRLPTQRKRAAVYIASETALVRKYFAELLRNSTAGNRIDACYFSFEGISHPVDIDGNKRTDTSTKVKSKTIVSESAERRASADVMFPYLEWWALAHSRVILVRRGIDLKPIGSTYSGTAHLYGGWK